MECVFACVECVWNVCGVCVECVFACVECVWNVCGVCVECVFACVECVWSVCKKQGREGTHGYVKRYVYKQPTNHISLKKTGLLFFHGDVVH